MCIITYVLIARLFARVQLFHFVYAQLNKRTFVYYSQMILAVILPLSTTYSDSPRRGESLLMRRPGWRFLSINNIISRCEKILEHQ